MYLDKEFHSILSVSNNFTTLTKMRTVIQNIDQQINRACIKSNNYNGYTTNGYVLLYNTIVRGMSSGLSKCNSDKDRLYGYLESQRRSLSDSFDSSATGGISSSRLFIASRSCREYIFSVEPRDPDIDYPLDKGKEAWKHYRALRYVDSDCDDFTLYITGGLLHPHKANPRFAIFTFDPIAAILQYNALKDDMSLPDYIHRYLIMPALTLDNIRLWLMGVYSQWFISRSRRYTDIPMVTSSYIHIPLMLDNALKDVADLLDSARSNSVNVNSILTSLSLPRNSNIPRYATTLYQRSSVSDIVEYDWGTFMIYRRMIDIAIRAMAATIRHPNTIRHVQAMRRAVMLLSRNHILSGILDRYTRQFVKTSITNLEMQLEDLYNSI